MVGRASRLPLPHASGRWPAAAGCAAAQCFSATSPRATLISSSQQRRSSLVSRRGPTKVLVVGPLSASFVFHRSCFSDLGKRRTGAVDMAKQNEHECTSALWTAPSDACLLQTEVRLDGSGLAQSCQKSFENNLLGLCISARHFHLGSSGRPAASRLSATPPRAIRLCFCVFLVLFLIFNPFKVLLRKAFRRKKAIRRN